MTPISLPPHPMDEPDEERAGATLQERPWTVLETIVDVDAWIDGLNRDLHAVIRKQPVSNPGVCFRLTEGGEIYLHTNGDGDVLLDVTEEADWVTPLISAATQVAAPAASLWILPGHVLTQLVLGLSPLVETTRLVLQHEFRTKKNKWR
ncbi:hypothetical protein [Actimicrobium antarcticum]|uniref:SCP2 domain-containing protein n=1 Tax=Actimicrobium antarcticum TaxID=1051899 RepID=A0ABP7TFT3_9BURK